MKILRIIFWVLAANAVVFTACSLVGKYPFYLFIIATVVGILYGNKKD